VTWLLPLAVTIAAYALAARLVRTSGIDPNDDVTDSVVYVTATAAALAAWIIWGLLT
jgi:hypothetical protein